jgi:hypothetical protein
MAATLNEPIEHFTGRDAEVAAYDELWTPTSRQRALAFSGFSGNGKSTLLLYLAERERVRKRPVVFIDLHAGFAQPDVFLRRLADELRAQVPGLKLRSFRRRLREAEHAATAIRRARPVVHNDIMIRADRQSTITNSPIGITISDPAGVNQRLADHWRQARHELLRELTQALRGLCWALFVDSYEVAAHAGDADFRSWFVAEFLAAMNRPDQGTRVAIAGREHLPSGSWQTLDLGEWDETRSDEFLRGWGIADEALLKAIYQHCRGHPLVTNLARDAWSAGERSGQPLRPDDLRSFPAASRYLALEWLMGQFIRRVPTDLADAVLYAAHFRHLTLDALNTVLPDGRVMDYATTYTRLQQLSFIRPAPDTDSVAYRAHDLIRVVEQARREREQPTERLRLNEAARAYFASRGDVLNELYHELVVDRSAAMSDWSQAMEAAEHRFDRAAQDDDGHVRLRVGGQNARG